MSELGPNLDLALFALYRWCKRFNYDELGGSFYHLIHRRICKISLLKYIFLGFCARCSKMLLGSAGSEAGCKGVNPGSIPGEGNFCL